MTVLHGCRRRLILTTGFSSRGPTRPMLVYLVPIAKRQRSHRARPVTSVGENAADHPSMSDETLRGRVSESGPLATKRPTPDRGLLSRVADAWLRSRAAVRGELCGQRTASACGTSPPQKSGPT